MCGISFLVFDLAGLSLHLSIAVSCAEMNCELTSSFPTICQDHKQYFWSVLTSLYNQKRKALTCTGADGLFANDMAQQVILVESRAIRSHRNRSLILCCPDVDNLIVGVGILERHTTAVLVYSDQNFIKNTMLLFYNLLHGCFFFPYLHAEVWWQ